MKDQLNTLPQFFDLLSEQDQSEYFKLRSTLSGPGTRNRRGKRLENFADGLDSIQKYAIRGDGNDWKRCLVCGVCWLNSGIAINTRQLRLLIDKCKSSINGSLHRMGYSTSTCKGDPTSSLIEHLPNLKGNFAELRQWTVRQKVVVTPQPDVSDSFVQPQYPLTPEISSDKDFEIRPPRFDEDPYHEEPYFDDPLCLPMNRWIEKDVNPETPTPLQFDFIDF